MATESIHVSALIPASPATVYDAWLSSEQHAKMTGGAAAIEPRVGGAHSAWDGYITGTTLELYPGRRVVQSWRSSDFPADSGDSRITVTFEGEGGQTRITIAHTDIPEGQGADYQSGWDAHYFQPMIAYFSATAPAVKAAAPAATAAPAKKAAPKKAAPKKAAPKKAAPAKKAAPKKAAAKKAAPKKAAPKKKAAAKKAAPKKAAVKKTARRKKVAARKG
jgi:uncharacterized protein YndB with AHSA1/START domain